jgi:hypothetical protein
MQIWGLHVGGKGMNWEVLKGLIWGFFENRFEGLFVGNRG